MRTTTLVKFAVATAASVVVLGGVAAAQPGSTAPLAPQDTVQRLIFIDQLGPFKNFDAPPKGTSLGDSQVFSDRSVTHNGQNVGFVGGICTNVVVTKKAGVLMSLSPTMPVDRVLDRRATDLSGPDHIQPSGPHQRPAIRHHRRHPRLPNRTRADHLTGAPHNRTKITVDLITG